MLNNFHLLYNFYIQFRDQNTLKPGYRNKRISGKESVLALFKVPSKVPSKIV